MRPKTLILFIVAIGCGLVASIGVSQYMEKAKGGGAMVETAKIYVATTEISPSEKLDAKNVSLEEWPKDRIPEGAITDLAQIEEKYSKQRMYKGEPILQAKLSDVVDGNATLTIPPGYRVVAVKVDENSSGGGLIRSGDRVDLVLFLRKSAEIPETTTRTILWDVNVFAVGGKTERGEDKQGTARDVRTVSLLVTPKQAEAVMLAKELGVLSLSLRRPGDPESDIASGETVRGLLGTDGENANEHKKKGQNEVVVAAPPVAPPVPVRVEPPVVVEPPAPPPAFTMTIRTNNGDHKFLFAKLYGPPVEDNAAPANPAPRPVVAPPPSVMNPIPPVTPDNPVEPPPVVDQVPVDLTPTPSEPVVAEEPTLVPAPDAGT